MSTAATIFSTSPRTSAAFHDDRRAPNRESTRSTTASRLRRPIGVPNASPSLVTDRRWEGWCEPQFVQLLTPTGGQLGAVGGHDLVRSGLRPRPPVPPPAQPPAGLLTRVLGPPGGLVAVDVAADLRRPRTERTHERRELGDLTGLRVERVAVPRERVPEPGITHDRGVSDAVDGLDAVHHTHRMQAPPPAVREHPGVDLQVQMPVRITRPGGVVPHHRRLQLLDRDLHLTAPRTHPGGRMRGQPADDLGRRPLLRRVVGGRDLGVHRRRQRPGLRPVDHHLDEPKPTFVGPQPTLRRAGTRRRNPATHRS